MDEPIENTVRDGGITDLLMPVRDRNLRSENDGPALVAVVADLQKVAAFAIFERYLGEVVQHQHVNARVILRAAEGRG